MSPEFIPVELSIWWGDARTPTTTQRFRVEVKPCPQCGESYRFIQPYAARLLPLCASIKFTCNNNHTWERLAEDAPVLTRCPDCTAFFSKMEQTGVLLGGPKETGPLIFTCPNGHRWAKFDAPRPTQGVKEESGAQSK